MKYPFKTKEENIEKYLFELKEVCIIEHEDNWFKEKSHTKLYPNIDEAKSKVAKPYYWILNAIDNYENDDCENKELALAELAILVFKSNYYSQKLTSETENVEVKKVLVNFMSNCDLSIELIADQIASKDVPKYARIEMDSKDVVKLISSWVN
jgi:antitoxin component HigA of HigAB toxin-antitoxin module